VRLGTKLLLPLLVYASAGLSPAAVADGSPAIVNLGVAGGRHHYTPLSGGGVSFYVPEAEQGGRDLNGDGDATDVVVHVWTPSTGGAVNLGLPLSGKHNAVYAWDMLVPLETGGFAFAVPELLHGQADLNGDGDVLDSVVHRWHPTTGVQNLGLAVETVTVCCDTDKYALAAVAGGDLAFLVPESGQGAKDRNGDGDASDSVAVVWDHATGELRNLGMSASEVLGLTDGGVALLTKESHQAKTDLNDDGDTGDEVAQVWRRSSGVRNLQLAARGVFPFGAGHLAVRVSEEDHGRVDRNGDGDTADTVIAVWDPAGPSTTENLELAEANDSAANLAALDRGHFAFRVSEVDQDADLTADGDRIDKVVHTWNPATGRTTNLRQAGRDLVAIKGGALAFEGSKLQIWEPETQTTTSAGFPNNGRAASMPDGRVAFGVAEFSVNRDLNADGDQSDYWIPHIWDPSTKTATSLGLVGEGVPLTAGGFAFGLHEPSQGFDVDGNGNGNEPGADFNGDGDGGDSVLHVWDGTRTTNLRLAGNPVAALDGNRFTAVTFENEHGGDLNGDGDATDMVVHIVDGDASPYAGGPGHVVSPPPAGGGSTDSPTPGPTGGSGEGTPAESGDHGVPDQSPVPAGTSPLGPSPSSAKSGYWMVQRDGTVHPFGDAKPHGHARVGAVPAVDLEPTPSRNGYWVVDDQGHVFGFGDARWLGNVARNHLVSGEKVTSLSATPTGAGYWMFTNHGRVVAFGDATHLGDVVNVTLNGPVLDSIATPTGRGYYMVASDGGIFAFGDARFSGSMGGRRLNAPVQSLVPDRDGDGYWLVASDGGIFSFDAPFRGSLGTAKLNKPITGMVRFGDGYLMVGEDGGIFNFSDRPFAGSLGDRPPSQPIVSVAAI